MATPNLPPASESRVRYWRRVLRPLLWWFLLVLILGAHHQHQLAMERTRIAFSIFLQGNNVGYATELKLDGHPVTSGQRIFLGDHTFTVVHPKAENFTTNFFAWYGGRDFGQINLHRAMGTLNVTANPPAQRINITGPEFARTLLNSPGTNVTVPTDTYEIQAQYPNWSQTQTIKVFDRQSASCVFAPRFSTLHLTCNREEATYQLQFANGQMASAGNLPATVTDLPSDHYQLTISYHHRQIQKTISLNPGVTNEIPFEFVLGNARLESEPAGAEVRSSDGIYLGQTPMEVTELTPPAAQFNLSLNGYEPASVTVNIVADQTTTSRTNLISTRYVNALQAARQSLAAANYERASQFVVEALAIRPDNAEALALQNEINVPLNAERERQEKLKRPRQVFSSTCAQYPDAELFREFSFKTSKPAKEVVLAIVQLLQSQPQAFEISSSREPKPETYAITARQGFSLGILGGSERVCALVVGQTKADETQILFRVLEYQVQHVIQANSLFNVKDEKQMIPLHYSRIQMNDTLQNRVREGIQIVTDKIQQAIGQP